MSSSESSRDGTNNNNKNTNNDNIFIQFKRNVDHKISGILSGFIGVPSHIKRNEREEDNRWQDIEDDRQRRIDERKQNERSMASPEHKSGSPAAMNGGQQTVRDDEEHSIPIKKFRIPASAPTPIDNSGCLELNNDYDLYSPFGTPELERLNMACKIERPAHLKILEGVQERFFLSMKDTWHASQDSEMAKEKTLMPYLLFSDYSPLRLTHLPPLRRRNMPGVVTFSYAEAFEELLEMAKDELSQPSAFEEVNDMFKAFGVPSDWILGANQGFGGRLGRQPMRSPLTAMEWIAGSLVERDVFRDESLYETVETPIGTFRAGKYSATTEILLNWMWNKHGYEAALSSPRSVEAPKSSFRWPKEESGATQTARETKDGPRSEQDMYDDFFSTPPAARVKYMDKEEEDDFFSPSSPSTSSSTSRQSFGTHTSVLDQSPAPSPPETEAHKDPWSWSSIQKPTEAASEKVVLISNVPGENEASTDDSNGLVLREVTEESETLADGTIKTTVITKKKYGNGKTQVVISTSFDKPAERRIDEHQLDDEVKDGKGVVTEVKEWFWK